MSRTGRAALRALSALAALLAAGSAHAGDVEILAAELRASGSSWSASVTLRHDDTGWDHYADAWRVVAPDGSVLGTRVLYHPHVEEQPFTRSLGGIAIPAQLDRVYVEARDSVHGWSPKRFEVRLER